MEKEVKIVAPEGYEIDDEKSTLERIVFKKKDDKHKPKTWDEYCKPTKNGCGKWFLNLCSGAPGYVGARIKIDECQQRVVCNSLEEAEAFVALMQLRQLRNAWVGDWEPDWCDDGTKYAVGTRWGAVCVMDIIHWSKPITFPTKAMAEEFMECFKDLLKQAKSLI